MGNALFRKVFAEWGVNPSEKDYGWDYLVEVFRGEESTGFLFSAQLKSSASTQYSKDRSFLSQSLEVPAADYLARQLKLPTFLFHADVDAGCLYWSAIQLDQNVLATLEAGNTQSLTVRIPTSNLLPNKFDGFAEDLRKAHCIVVNRALSGIGRLDFIATLAAQPVEAAQEAAEDLHDTAFQIEIQAAHDTFRKGDLDGAIALLKTIVASPTASVLVRFNATRNLGKFEWMAIVRSDKPQTLAAERQLATARELHKIAKDGPDQLRAFALISKVAAELGIAVQEHLGLVMIWRGQIHHGTDPLWFTILTFRLSASLQRAHGKLRRAIRLTNLIARSRHRWIAPRSISEIATEAAKLSAVLHGAEFNELADQYRESSFGLFRLAADIAEQNRNPEEFVEAIDLALMLEKAETGPVIAWARSELEKLKEGSEARLQGEAKIDRVKQRLNGATFESDIKTNGRQVFRIFWPLWATTRIQNPGKAGSNLQSETTIRPGY
jgi:hypothetical protein